MTAQLVSVAAWISRHRSGMVVALTAVATVGMLAGGIAVIQASGTIGGPDGEATAIDDPRPTATATPEPSSFGPILPRPGTPATPAPTPTPAPPTGGPGDEPTPVAPQPEPTAEPTATDPAHPSDSAPGQVKKRPGG